MKEAGGIYYSGGDEEATSGASNGGSLITPDIGSIEVKLSETLNDGVAHHVSPAFKLLLYVQGFTLFSQSLDNNTDDGGLSFRAVAASSF